VLALFGFRLRDFLGCRFSIALVQDFTRFPVVGVFPELFELGCDLFL
jgi:hypothetical protein